MSVESTLENIRRLRAYNHELAAFRYYALPGSIAPARPVLFRPGPIAVVYEPRTVACGPRSPDPVGAGPDQYDYYLPSTDPDGYAVGDLFHSPRTGGVYCRVETYVAGGGLAPRWLRIT